MTNLSENVLASVSGGGVKSFEELSTSGKVTASVCAVAGVVSLVGFCVATCMNVAKKLIK